MTEENREGDQATPGSPGRQDWRHSGFFIYYDNDRQISSLLKMHMLTFTAQ